MADSNLGELLQRQATLDQLALSLRAVKAESAFDKWVLDTLNFTVEGCRPKGAPALPDFPIQRAGSYSLPEAEQMGPLCDALVAQGVSPVCVRASFVGNRRMPEALPRDYLQFDSEQAAKVQGGLECHLVSRPPQGLRPQFFVPDAKDVRLEWLAPPTLKSFMTGQGAKQLNAGTVRVTVRLGKGAPYSEVRTAVLPNP